MRRACLALCFALLLGGCMSATRTTTSPEYMASDAYEQREPLTKSLFPGDTAVLSNEAVEQVLSSRITLPISARIAILRLGEQTGWMWWSEELWRLDKQILDGLTDKLSASRRVADVMIMPALLTPDCKSVPVLREAAARCQANLLFIYRSSEQTYGKTRFLAPDEVKAWCVVEAVLLDVRTGIIPWTASTVKTYAAKKSPDDLTFGETMHRAQLTALREALVEAAADLSSFLDGVPIVACAPASEDARHSAMAAD